MPEIRLSEKERDELLLLQRKSKDKRAAIRILAVLALDEGYAATDVARILRVDEDTVTTWKKLFLARKSSGDTDWLALHCDGYDGRLTEEQESIVKRYVSKRVITDCLKVAAFIKRKFKAGYSRDGVTKLLHRLNFVYKQTVTVPAKARIRKQKTFLRLFEKLKTCLKKTEIILFSDGVHPTHNTHTIRCWVQKGEEKTIKTNSGRSRLNIQGAYDAAAINVVSMFSKTIDAIAVMAFFDKIQTTYAWATRIYFICDNAKYYKNKDVRVYLKQPGCKVKVIFLPSYSPNLNFIERLWKYMRQKVIGVKYREKFPQFEADIRYFFDHIEDHRDTLRSFIGTKLHLIQT